MTGPILLALGFVAYGLAYVAFAFRDPPPVLERLFRVPSIVVFLPAAHRRRVGRLAVGALYVLTPALVALQVLRASAPGQ